MLFFITAARVSRGGLVELRTAIELGFVEDDVDWGLYCGLEEGG
jgi:hypothetical protein